MEDKDIKEYNCRTTNPFSLKDKEGRVGVLIDFMETFKFIPKRIIVKKIPGQNNRLTVSAILEDEDTERESAEEGGALNG